MIQEFRRIFFSRKIRGLLMDKRMCEFGLGVCDCSWHGKKE